MSITSLTAKIMIGATTVAAGFVAAPTGISHAAYNIGVKSLDFTPVIDWCLPDQALPCTPGAGSGESNTLRVTQSVVDGYHQFNGLESTSAIDGSLWVAADIGAECRRGYKLFSAEVSQIGGSGDGMGIVPQEVDVAYSEVSVPNARTMPVKRVTVEFPIDDVSIPGGSFGDPSVAEGLFAYGEDVIADRIDGGMSPAEARALPFETVVPFSMSGHVVCRGIIGAHFKYEKYYTLPTTLTIEYVGVDVDAPAGDQAGPADLIASPEVTDAELFVVQDPADPCTLHLSGAIHANQPMTVDYRFINPNGQPSNTYSIDIDPSLSALFDRTVAVPMLEGNDPSDDLAVVGGHSDLDNFYAESVEDQYSGTYMLEVISPNHVLAGDGFAVDFCTAPPAPSKTVVGNGAAQNLAGDGRPTH